LGKIPAKCFTGCSTPILYSFAFSGGVVPVVSLPQELEASVRYDCPIRADPAKSPPLPISSGGSPEFGKAHEVYLCKHFDIQRVCLEKMQRRYKDIISRKVCQVVSKQTGIQALS